MMGWDGLDWTLDLRLRSALTSHETIKGQGEDVLSHAPSHPNTTRRPNQVDLDLISHIVVSCLILWYRV